MCSHPHPKSEMSLASNSHCQCTRETGQQHHVVGIVIEPTSPFSREELLPACILLTNTFYSLSWVFMQKLLNSGLWQAFIILVTSHSRKSQLPQSTFYASICVPCRERNAGLSYTPFTGEASKARKGSWLVGSVPKKLGGRSIQTWQQRKAQDQNQDNLCPLLLSYPMAGSPAVCVSIPAHIASKLKFPPSRAIYSPRKSSRALG